MLRQSHGSEPLGLIAGLSLPEIDQASENRDPDGPSADCRNLASDGQTADLFSLKIASLVIECLFRDGPYATFASVLVDKLAP